MMHISSVRWWITQGLVHDGGWPHITMELSSFEQKAKVCFAAALDGDLIKMGAAI